LETPDLDLNRYAIASLAEQSASYLQMLQCRCTDGIVYMMTVASAVLK